MQLPEKKSDLTNVMLRPAEKQVPARRFSRACRDCGDKFISSNALERKCPGCRGYSRRRVQEEVDIYPGRPRF